MPRDRLPQELRPGEEHLPLDLSRRRRQLRDVPWPWERACEAGDEDVAALGSPRRLWAGEHGEERLGAAADGGMRTVPFAADADPCGLPRGPGSRELLSALAARGRALLRRRSDFGRSLRIRLVLPEQDVQQGCEVQRLP